DWLEQLEVRVAAVPVDPGVARVVAHGGARLERRELARQERRAARGRVAGGVDDDEEVVEDHGRVGRTAAGLLSGRTRRRREDGNGEDPRRLDSQALPTGNVGILTLAPSRRVTRPRGCRPGCARRRPRWSP